MYGLERQEETTRPLRGTTVMGIREADRMATVQLLQLVSNAHLTSRFRGQVVCLALEIARGAAFHVKS